MVVIFHFIEMVIGDYSKLYIGHSWLAVDLFFCLSGFVIGYAYDDLVGAMGDRAYRSHRGDGGIYVIWALGGAGASSGQT